MASSNYKKIWEGELIPTKCFVIATESDEEDNDGIREPSFNDDLYAKLNAEFYEQEVYATLTGYDRNKEIDKEPLYLRLSVLDEILKQKEVTAKEPLYMRLSNLVQKPDHEQDHEKEPLYMTLSILTDDANLIEGNDRTEHKSQMFYSDGDDDDDDDDDSSFLDDYDSYTFFRTNSTNSDSNSELIRRNKNDTESDNVLYHQHEQCHQTNEVVYEDTHCSNETFVTRKPKMLDERTKAIRKNSEPNITYFIPFSQRLLEEVSGWEHERIRCHSDAEFTLNIDNKNNKKAQKTIKSLVKSSMLALPSWTNQHSAVLGATKKGCKMQNDSDIPPQKMKLKRTSPKHENIPTKFLSSDILIGYNTDSQELTQTKNKPDFQYINKTANPHSLRKEQSQEQHTPLEQQEHIKKAQWKQQKNKFDGTWTVELASQRAFTNFKGLLKTTT